MCLRRHLMNICRRAEFLKIFAACQVVAKLPRLCLLSGAMNWCNAVLNKLNFGTALNSQKSCKNNRTECSLRAPRTFCKVNVTLAINRETDVNTSPLTKPRVGLISPIFPLMSFFLSQTPSRAPHCAWPSAFSLWRKGLHVPHQRGSRAAPSPRTGGFALIAEGLAGFSLAPDTAPEGPRPTCLSRLGPLPFCCWYRFSGGH